MQFHDPDAGTGFVEIMRNNACTQPTFCLKMRTLQKDAHYRLTNAETGAQLRLCGADLLSGVNFALPLRSSAIYFYEQLPD